MQERNDTMYTFLHELLADKTGGEIFELFGPWHFGFVGFTLATIVAVLLLFRNKSLTEKKRVSRVFIRIAFGLYMADFFLMPFAYGRIDIEKLPFHACTAMCVMCFASQHNKVLQKYRTSFAMLGFISNLVYLLYPAGVMWYSIHPTSYRVLQTLFFHSFMTIYTFLTLVYERDKMDIKKIYRDVAVIVGMTIWALIGSYCYTATTDGYSYFFNWFFVLRDPFNMFPKELSAVLMPVLNITLFSLVELIFHIIFKLIKREKA